jgi:hypothetical protein
LAVTAEAIWPQKTVFGNPFLTLRFPAVAASAGKRYYIWVEAGPRNRDAIWTLWSVKTYSRVPAHEVAAALVEAPPEPLDGWAGRVVLILLVAGTVWSAAWLVAVVAVAPVTRFRRQSADPAGPLVAAVEG